MLGIHRDLPRRQIEMKVSILADLQETVLSFGFHQNWLSGFVAVGGRNSSFPMDFTKLMENGQISVKGQISTSHCRAALH